MDGYFGTFPTWADFLSFCFNDCSKVEHSDPKIAMYFKSLYLEEFYVY